MLSILPDAVVTTTARPVTINVLANDAGDALTITSFSKPANGSLVFNADKSFTYTPAEGFVGDDGFSYTVRDEQGTPANIEVTISVLPDDSATVATDDIVEVVAGRDVIIPVLANDMVVGDGSLRISAVSVPGYGAANVLPDQTIRYVPQRGFIGIDSFNYTVTDGQGNSASATITVKVVASNSEPLAVSDAFTIEVGATTILAVLSNDSDPDGGPLQVVGFTMPNHGKLVFNSDKTFTYTPDAGYQGPDQFSYTIRDSQGASAAASVALDIVETAESAVAFDDRFTTTAGAPVTVDVLANDTLPAEQSIMIVAVTLPFKGRLTFNPDKTIIYTPNAGFVGTDDFTYTIGNGQGGTAKATVTIEVTPASNANVYANGYAYRRRLAIPAGSAKGASHTNFPLWVDLAGSWLKSTANGGKLVSADGHDLRFELEGGTRLAHELEHYDAVAGKLGAWVRLPELGAEQPTVLLLYYGKPGLAASEAEPEAVWQDYLAVWHLPEAQDATGASRSLTAQGSIATSSNGLGMGALSIDGNGVLTIADASWLSDHSALSVQLRNKASTIGHDRGQLVAGVEAFTGNSDLFIRYQSTGFGVGQPKDVIHSSIGTTAGKFRVSSKADTQSTDWQSLTLAWQSGDTEGSLHLDGKKIQPSFTTTNAGAGTTLIGGPLYIGAGTQDSATGGWVGLIDEVRFRAERLSNAWIDVEYTNQKAPALFYGIGAEDAFGDSSESIVAVPFQRMTPAGENIDIDVLAGAVGAESGSEIAIQGVSQPANGFASVFGNQVRYSPSSGFAGTDSFTYTLVSNGKRSTATIAITVRSSASDPQTGSQGDNAEPWNTVQGIDIPALTATTTHNVSNAAQLSDAIDTVNTTSSAGHHIVLANGSYSGDYTIYAQGTQANPVVVRPATFLGATLTGTLTVCGSWVIVRGININRITTASVTVGSTTYRANNCRWSRNAMTNNGFFGLNSGASYCCFDRNELAGGSGRSIDIRPRSGADNTFRNAVVWNLIRDVAYNDNNEACVGSNYGSYSLFNNETETLFAYNRMQNIGAPAIQFKGSGNYCVYNTIIGNNSAPINHRHGRRSVINANYIPNSTDWISIRGEGHEVIGNYVPVGGCRARAGNIPTGSAGEPTNELRPGWTFAEDVKYIGNTGKVEIGGTLSYADYAPLRCLVEDHNGTVIIDPEARQTIDRRNSPPSQEVPVAFLLQASDVGPYS